ncbi:hypothetical protein Pmar_PMAR005164 [Perkinsus marinus ATCC 50983]|uniref:Uncharacterized protein n=1 Tax=Perkinsus marinus (strain ATCC 50983 / TXsc) TaxID=423536 RepID=C5KAT3_PERM5|nr:hypothetical protein Pmar_PMAR005164 [Perkinsus marinus ATCC 50983]EER18259.1 hypothetical protein Pmar_PMAR005164 [Perkinsus marinus ATCC 50983]|eukprot:XP_002786463.1 hypothetical protein Pmar_PMAR005164 [Perkinsus marinus ATCC 50983]
MIGGSKRGLKLGLGEVKKKERLIPLRAKEGAGKSLNADYHEVKMKTTEKCLERCWGKSVFYCSTAEGVKLPSDKGCEFELGGDDEGADPKVIRKAEGSLVVWTAAQVAGTAEEGNKTSKVNVTRKKTEQALQEQVRS